MKHKNKVISTIRISATLALLLTGCTGYRLGSMLPPEIKTVYVPTFANQTTEPLLEMEATDAVIIGFQRDGSLDPTEEETADARLDVTINRYRIEPIGFQKNSESTANEYRVIISASVVFRRMNGQVMMEHPRIEGEATFIFSGDLALAKREALPESCEDLAHNIVEKIVEMW